ncbi:MAG: OmpP1/FadL family transporter [Rhodocyclaceae bacterium]
MKLSKIAALLAATGLTAPAFATNGMNMEGYGAVATAMGGASMAYENGPGAMMNNPATLGLMPQGRGIGVALGHLGPDVNSSVPALGMNAASGGDSYWMPAFGYIEKSGKLTYGVGIYAQGGMGTEYAANSFLAMGTGQDVRSEVGVGRVILPLAYNVSDKLTIGGSLDWIWATMDIKMAAGVADFMAMTTSMTPALGGAVTGLLGMGANTFRLDFSDNNDFSGQAFGSGWGGKLGFVYKASPQLSIGGTYHMKTNIDDMETDSNKAYFSAYNVGGGGALGAPVAGKVTIHDFQWPETYGLGIAYQPNDKWLIAVDYKRLNWSKVMKDFRMTYSTGAFGGADAATMKISQNWSDQDVFMIGAAYRFNDALTIRFGGNFAKNPVPDNRVHPLFPATIKEHYTFGLGYAFSKQSALDFSLTYAPEVTVTGTQTTGAPGSGIGGNAGIRISHSQLNWSLQYGYRF